LNPSICKSIYFIIIFLKIEKIKRYYIMVAIVFMVAGMSSRFGGKPKQLERVGPNNETLIEYSVNQALKNDFSQLIFITNPKTEHLFKELFNDVYMGRNVMYVQQYYDTTKRARPWGTTDAICSLCGNIEESIILVNGDDIYGSETFKIGYERMKRNPVNIIGTLKLLDTLPESGTVNRGVIDVHKDFVTNIEEHLNISRENTELYNSYANINFIGLQYNVLEMLLHILGEFKSVHKDDPKIECLLPNNLSSLIKDGHMEMEYFVIEESILGITNPGDEIILREKLKQIHTAM